MYWLTNQKLTKETGESESRRKKNAHHYYSNNMSAACSLTKDGRALNSLFHKEVKVGNLPLSPFTNNPENSEA